MASKEKETPKETKSLADVEKYPVEQLQAQTGMSDAVHAGICIKMGWSSGKEITEKEYLQAAEAFRAAGAGRSRHA